MIAPALHRGCAPISAASTPAIWQNSTIESKGEGAMGLFDGLLSSFGDGEAEKVVGAFLDQHGGIEGVAAQFEKQGLGGTVESWLGDAANPAVTGDQIHQAFGAEGLAAIARLTGMSTQDVAQKLADHLPAAAAQRQGGAAAKPAGDADAEDGNSDSDDSDRNDSDNDDSDDGGGSQDDRDDDASS